VVTCLPDKEFKSELDDNFKRCLEFRDVNSSMLANYKDKFDFIELSKLAIDYSDGIIEGYNGANSALLDYARSKNIPLLSYPGEDYADAYLEFFNKVADSAE
jgi:starch synthase